MGLFAPDFFRSFFVGFGVSAAIMAAFVIA